MVYVIPLFQRASRVTEYPDKKGVIRYRPVHPKIFVAYVWLQVITLVVVLWGIFLTLVFSIGWHNPLSWEGLWFDLIYARANGHPDGAHIISWLSCAGFGLVIWYKTIPKPIRSFHDLLGDPFQGIAGLIFMGGVHEIMWLPFYYSAYWQYLSWSLLFEVLRDVSFGVMMVLFILTFWKHPTRVVPLSIFKKITFVYLVFLICWFFLPYQFVHQLLPITTLNNPNFGQGLYQETPWFPLWWVNGIEEIGWLILSVPSMIAVAKYNKARREDGER